MFRPHPRIPYMGEKDNPEWIELMASVAGLIASLAEATLVANSRAFFVF
jgi:hypothetical protein